MKSKKLFLLVSSILMPTISFSTLSCSKIEFNLPPSQSEANNNISLSFSNYFSKGWENAYQSRNEIKNKITSIIDKYRLKEWNEYYNSNVLSINLSDYDQECSDYGDFDWSSIEDKNIATKSYNNQDEQFQYFNDFINLINEEDSKNQEDFLYKRWEYYSTFAARLYHEKVGFPFTKNQTRIDKEINQIMIVDWIESITKTFIEANPNDLLAIVFTFMTYYGIVPDLSQFEDYFDSLKEELKKPGQLINNLKDNIEEWVNKLKEKFGEDFPDQLEELYQKFKELYKKIFNEDISFKDFIKNFKNYIDEFKNLSEESKELINQFQSIISKLLNIDDVFKEELLNFVDAIEKAIKDSIPDIKPPDFVSDINFGLQNSIFHAKLCAEDMLMRLLSKNDKQDSNYKIWQAKKTRAFEIYKLMSKYNNLLIDSFLIDPNDLAEQIVDSFFNEIDKVFPSDNLLLKPVRKILRNLVESTLSKLAELCLSQVKQMLNTLISKTLGELRLVHIELNDYSNKK